MSRGAFSKRSGGGGSAGPPPGASYVIVAATAAALAAYPDTGLPQGEPAWVATFLCPYLLNRASVAVPDGILVIATSTGVGTWERQEIPHYHWQTQADWFIDQAGGNDEHDGNTALTPVSTHAEIQRRIGPSPLVDLDITWLTSSTEDVFFDWEGNRFVFEHGKTTDLFSGTITAAPQNWSGFLRNDAQITSATLPVSWTASGLLHRFARLTSGASSGMTFFIAQDLGAKKARASIPCDVPGFTFAEGAFALNNTFTAFEVPTLSGYVTFSTRLRPGFFALQNLRLGADGVASQNEVDLGVAFALNCIFNGTTVNTQGNVQAVGCYFTKGILNGAMFLQASAIEDVLTITGGNLQHESSFVQNSASYGLVLSARASATLVGSFFGHLNAANGVQMSEESTAVSRDGFYWFGRTVATNGIIMTGGCKFGFDRNFRPAFGALGGTDSSVGGAPKVFSQWPYENTITDAATYLNAGDVPLDDFIALTADQTTNSAAFVDLPTVTDTFTVLGSRSVDIDFTIQVAADAGAQPEFQLVFDGAATTMRGAGGAIVGPQNVSLSFRISVNSGGHTIKVQWRNVGGAGFIYCRPATNPNLESSSLRVKQALV